MEELKAKNSFTFKLKVALDYGDHRHDLVRRIPLAVPLLDA
jgi:hypothetical protein